MLEPLLDRDAAIYDCAGHLAIQLEVPNGSSLTPVDIAKIMSIASWRGGRIDDKIVSIEGGRAAVIEKERPVGRLHGLLLSGIGYAPPKKIGNFYDLCDSMQPPSTLNFMEIVDKDKIRTSVVVDGQIVTQRPAYAPLGSYCSERLKRKIINTRNALRLPISFIRPTVEAWGRYVDLKYRDQNLGFAVFGIPSAHLSRFMAQYVQKAATDENSLMVFLRDMANLMKIMGWNLKKLHKAGFAHHQPHFSNFYMLGRDICLMDWSTMAPLGNTSIERAMNKAIDLRIVQQDVGILCEGLYGLRGANLYEISMAMMSEIVSAYYGRRVDMVGNFLALAKAGMDNMTEMEALIKVVEGNGRVKV